jgi:hypothetical protein
VLCRQGQSIQNMLINSCNWYMPLGSEERFSLSLKTFYNQRINLIFAIYITCRSQLPRGLRRTSTAARLLISWVRIPPREWMFVCCECCVLPGRGLCDELITRPDECYRLWCHDPHWVAAPQEYIYIYIYFMQWAFFGNMEDLLSVRLVKKKWKHVNTNFNVSLTLHLSINLANEQLDAQFLIRLLQFATCFEKYLSHPQEVKLY